MCEGPEQGGRGPFVTQQEGDLTEGRASHSREESPEAGLEDLEVDGADQFGSGTYRRLGGTGGKVGQEDPGLGGGRGAQAKGVSVCEGGGDRCSGRGKERIQNAFETS